MFIRVNNGHLRVRNGTTAVGCGIRMPKNVHFNVPSGQSINKRLSSNVDKVTKDIIKMSITPKAIPKATKKYIKF